ncbi:AfsR/SARP family transcriptional regulator [Micromonospora sp. NPDC050417]|uniref:AfsR/SARP family transcriptional regulator n=1 Tax=Micromonospora sp. NPDC050417 TaxID=3364280 RepID=UPI0037AE5713
MGSGHRARRAVRLLGPVELIGPDGPVPLTDEVRRMLGLLALRAGQPVAAADLRGVLPPGATPEIHSLDGAAAALAAALDRAGLPNAVVAHPIGYLLRLPPRRVDVQRFTRLITRARRRMAAEQWSGALPLFDAALRLWRVPLHSDPLGGCPPRPSGWLAAEVGRLVQGRVAAVEERWECALRLALAAQATAGGPTVDRASVVAGLAAARTGLAAVGELEAALARHPLRVRLWELLLVASAIGAGRSSAAKVEQRARDTFREQLGVEPGERLRFLAAAAQRGDLAQRWLPSYGPEPVSRLAERAVARAPLPVPMTPLLGRDALLAVVNQRLATQRLVTLTGPGGAGKTRLAVAAASRFGSAWFVDLSSVESPVRVPEAAAAALGVRAEPGRDVVDTLAEEIGGTPALLVLDNCEHLIAGGAELVDRLLGRCPGLLVLATSRVPLRLPTEAVVTVPTLAVPPEVTGNTIAGLSAHPATRLFLERARARSGRPVPEASADAVAQLCVELDGLPLAIELAAAHVSVLGVGEIVARLRTDPRLLSSPDPTAPSRHRTLAAAVETSVERLDPAARALFERLAVCVGGFDGETASAVAGPDAPAALAALVESSLVVPAPLAAPPLPATLPPGLPPPAGLAPTGLTPAGLPSSGLSPAGLSPAGLSPAGLSPAGLSPAGLSPAGLAPPEAGWGGDRPGEPLPTEPSPGGSPLPPRYRMLVPIRRHALVLLGDGEAAARTALAKHCLGLAEWADARLRGTDQEWWLRRLRAEAANLRAAMSWLAEAGASADVPPYAELRLAAALARYCRLDGHYRDGHRWLAAALDRHPEAPPEVRAGAGAAAAMLAMLSCDYPAATRRAEAALVAYRQVGDQAGVARVLLTLGSIAREQARYVDSTVYLATAAATFAEYGDEWGEAQTVQLRGFTAWLSGDLDRADSRLRVSRRWYERLGDPRAEAETLMNLGAVALYRGDTDRAASLLDVALRRYSEVGFPEGVGWAHNLRGLVELRARRPDRAGAHLLASLAAHRQVGDRWRTASVLEALAEVARLEGDAVRGARLLGAAAGIRAEIGAPVPACERPDTEATGRALRGELGDAGFVVAHGYGLSAPLDSLLAAFPGRGDRAPRPAASLPLTG